MTLIAAADGSALGNPGPAGWAWYIDADRWASGGWPKATNNAAELTAVLELLRHTARSDDDLLIYCDSMYVINSLTKWLPGWKRRGWRKGDGKPVLNLEIMQALDEALAGRKVRFEWVKGHSGHPLNEAADRLANGAAVAFSQGRVPEAAPEPELAQQQAAPSQRLAGPPADLFADAEIGEPEPSDFDRVIALERSLLADEVRSDPSVVAALLHPDWVEIGASGRLWSRADLLAQIGPLPGPVQLEVVSIDQVGEQSVLLVWRSIAAAGAALRSSLWVKDGDWRQRFHQGTTEA